MVTRLILIYLFSFLFHAEGFSQPVPKWKIEAVQQFLEKEDGPVIINFWATWCRPCIEELPYFQKVANQYADRKVKLLLVSLDFQKDYPENIRRFAEKNGYDARIVWLDETNADHFCPFIDSSWTGAIPATLIYEKNSGYRYFHEGQIREEKLQLLLNDALKQKETSLLRHTNHPLPESKK